MAHELPYIAAIGEAIHLEMERDESVLYFGQNRQALAPPRGPVYLELPMDVLFSDADGVPGPSRSSARAFGDPREVMKAAELLTKASARP